MKRIPAIVAIAAALLAASCARAGKTDGLFSVEGKAVTEQGQTGGKGTAEIRIKVKPEGHISEEAPLKATLAGKNVQVSKDKLGKADAVYKDGGAAFSVPFVAESSGSIDANLVFFICSKDLCERHESKLSIPVTGK